MNVSRRADSDDGDTGAAAVEFAIVLPLLIFLVFGLIDFALILNANLSITNAAHEGARASLLRDSASDVQARVRSNANPLGYTRMTEAAAPTVVNAGCATAGIDTTVTASYTLQLIVPLPGISSVTVRGRGVERCFTS